MMNSPQPPLYPLRLQPICQYRLWGGHRLAALLSVPFPNDAPVGEAWLLSDRDEHASVVAGGPLKGRTLRQLLAQSPVEMLGTLAGRCERFPVLLKFLDARDVLSVQVHPSDTQTDYLPDGENGKTEAWIVLETGPDACIYAGLKPGTTRDTLRSAITGGTVPDRLASFTPQPGDGIFIPAGTVHSLRDVVVFEVQENSDITFRLFDWNHIDARSGQPRRLQVDQSLACLDFTQGALSPVEPTVDEIAPVLRERLFTCEHFGLWRYAAEYPFGVGAESTPRVLVCRAGDGQVEHRGASYDIGKGDVILLPAVIGACLCRPHGAITVLEISLPEAA